MAQIFPISFIGSVKWHGSTAFTSCQFDFEFHWKAKMQNLKQEQKQFLEIISCFKLEFIASFQTWTKILQQVVFLGRV